jgi:ATP-dependent helicase/nuclease subunit B
VWLTRADRQDGSPTVASRWLQRLTAYAGKELSDQMRARGRTVLEWAKSLDAEDKADPPVRPRPSPPISLRPKQLSATRIETLIRDPYAIYAQYVLKLRAFESLGKLPDAAERGTLTHAILEQIVRERPQGPFDAAAEARLLEIGYEAFAAHADFPEVQALWWPRFMKIAHFFIETETKWSDVLRRHVENEGELPIGEFTLTARADRLDSLTDGGLAIIDYKTGAPPGFKEVRTLSPQLPLEGLIARAGGFDGLAPTEPRRIVYYRLNGKGEGGECKDLSAELQLTLELTDRRLKDLVQYFASPDAVYLSNKIPKPRRTYVGDYDHLARIAEWVATDEEDDAAL